MKTINLILCLVFAPSVCVAVDPTGVSDTPPLESSVRPWLTSPISKSPGYRTLRTVNAKPAVRTREYDAPRTLSAARLQTRVDLMSPERRSSEPTTTTTRRPRYAHVTPLWRESDSLPNNTLKPSRISTSGNSKILDSRSFVRVVY